MNRRKFLAIMGSAGVISALGTAKVANAGVHTFPYYADSYGVLHDTTRCIGCRRCEEACNAVNHLPKPKKPFTDLSVTATTVSYTHLRAHETVRQGRVPQVAVLPLQRPGLRLCLFCQMLPEAA